jgi:hypothetical protein
VTSAIRWRVFACACIAIHLVAFLMVRLAPRPAVQIGAALDVAVTVPVLYFLLVVRAGLQPLVSLLPLCLFGLLRATWLVPRIAAARPPVAAAAELAVIALIVVRLRRGFHAAGAARDALERIETAASAIVPWRPAAAVLAGEMAVFYYAFGAWWQRPHAPEGSRAFSIHQQSGVAALFGALAGAGLIEAGLVHLVVMRWSVVAAWVLSALSLYGTVWLIAAARSFPLRPVLLEPGELLARGGMIWTVRIPLAAIRAIESGVARYDLKLPAASHPNLVLRLAQPVTAHGMYGMTRQVASLALAIDDPAGFHRALRAAGLPAISCT